MKIEKIYQSYLSCNAVSTDTRRIKDNDLFIALKGDNFNGNLFVKDAFEKGAAYALVDEKSAVINKNCILCNNSLETLQELARHHRRQMNASIIGITGTNGKTTTKELCKAVLSSHYKTMATEGNLNNHIGVPLTLLKIMQNTEYAIIEMGANHPGEIKRLAEIAEPDFGLITNVGKAHIEGFGSFEGVKKTKAELYDYLRHSYGIAFVNIDNEHLLEMLGEQEIISYGFNNPASCKAEQFKSDIYTAIRTDDGEIVSNLRGSYNAENILAAACMGKTFGIPSEKIKSGIENYIPTNQRSEIRKTKRNNLFLDLYNANLSSMELAIKDFKNANQNQVLILGDMKELGNISHESHRQILALIQKLGFEDVLLSGTEFFEHKENFPYLFFKTTDALELYLKDHEISNTWIFIKGSRSMHLERIVDFL